MRMANGRHDGQGETTIEGSMDMIFHVTAAIDWRAAAASGAYRLSTRDRSAEDEGFIDCSYVTN